MRTLPGFSLPLVDTDDGPALVVEGQLDWPLCVVANAAVRGEITDLAERLKIRDRFMVGTLAVTPAPPELDLAEQIARFLAESGYDEESMTTAGGWFVMDDEPYPAAMIVDIYDALDAERMRWQRERARVDHAANAWASSRRIAADPSDPLFRVDALDGVEPSEAMREEALHLEQAATLVDRLQAELETHPAEPHDALVEHAARTSVKRRFLLVELTRFGILDASAFDAKQSRLTAWGCSTIIGYLNAARAWADYMTSADRAKFAPGIPAYPASGGARLSIDWFRVPTPIPAKVVVGPLAWTAWCEREADDKFSRDTHGDGWWLWHSGSVSHTFYWRRDDGVHPCLYKVT